MAMASAFGDTPWPAAMAFGRGQRPWPKHECLHGRNRCHNHCDDHGCCHASNLGVAVAGAAPPWQRPFCGHCFWRSPKAMAIGHGGSVCAGAHNRGHGRRGGCDLGFVHVMGMAFRCDQRPWRAAMVNRHRQTPWPRAMVKLHGPWSPVVAMIAAAAKTMACGHCSGRGRLSRGPKAPSKGERGRCNGHGLGSSCVWQ